VAFTVSWESEKISLSLEVVFVHDAVLSCWLRRLPAWLLNC